MAEIIDTLNEKITLIVEEDDAGEIETVENKEEETDYTSDTAHQESSSSIGDWTKLSINTLRTPVSKQLDVKDSRGTRKRDNFLRTTLGTWAKAKQDSVSVQQQVLLEKHRQKKIYQKVHTALCHTPKCPGPQQPEVPVGAVTCQHCNRSFINRRAYTTHERQAHPVARNEARTADADIGAAAPQSADRSRGGRGNHEDD
ncbi:unnamed protein product [Psylliodes chrysocephalus]|uniref:C2H2-type domain-containing protein n=1 Tax=Psylliodes chrysocephalus TaxID=3402493 RepID=A0A9P0D115_9CUCU|nr:unnamed protein product [Psylliodes chrysocephala]